MQILVATLLLQLTVLLLQDNLEDLVQLQTLPLTALNNTHAAHMPQALLPHFGPNSTQLFHLRPKQTFFLVTP